MPIVDGGRADDTRAVYPMTRDNVLEVDTGASGPGSSSQAHSESACAAIHPGARAHRVQLRGTRRTLLHSEKPLSATESRKLVRTWHRGNLFRLTFLGVAGWALRQSRRPNRVT
jgi:hypothetical protein